MSASSRSDPVMGSEMCTDDGYAFDGKNASMKWKLIGEKTLLMPTLSLTKIEGRDKPDGGFHIEPAVGRRAWEVPGWKGAFYCPIDAIYTPRPVWILELFPKDPYYNYGRMILYVDKVTYHGYARENYDRAGQYWKTVYLAWDAHYTPKGREAFNSDFYLAIDDKIHHGTYIDMKRPGAPYEVDSPMTGDNFTENFLLQLSK